MGFRPQMRRRHPFGCLGGERYRRTRPDHQASTQASIRLGKQSRQTTVMHAGPPPGKARNSAARACQGGDNTNAEGSGCTGGIACTGAMVSAGDIKQARDPKGAIRTTSVHHHNAPRGPESSGAGTRRTPSAPQVTITATCQGPHSIGSVTSSQGLHVSEQTLLRTSDKPGIKWARDPKSAIRTTSVHHRNVPRHRLNVPRLRPIAQGHGTYTLTPPKVVPAHSTLRLLLLTPPKGCSCSLLPTAVPAHSTLVVPAHSTQRLFLLAPP